VAAAHGCVALVLGCRESVPAEELIEVIDGVLEVLVCCAAVTAPSWSAFADGRQSQEGSECGKAELLDFLPSACE
jgi:hypothetical protein